MRIALLATIGLAAIGPSIAGCGHGVSQSDVSSIVDSDITSMTSSMSAAAPTTHTYTGPTLVIENNVMTPAERTPTGDYTPTFTAAQCTNVALVNKDSVPHHLLDSPTSGTLVNVTVQPNSTATFKAPRLGMYLLNLQCDQACGPMGVNLMFPSDPYGCS